MSELTISAIRTDALAEMDLSMVERAMPRRAERARRFRFEKDRLLCLGAGYLMMRSVGLRHETELCVGENGKPYAPGFTPFSISHSGIWCILASGAHGNIGVDIEALCEAHLDVAPMVYTPKELEWMAQDPLHRFFCLWTWKESVMKATGRGMEMAPISFEVLPFAENRPVQYCGREWFARSGSLDGYQYSVCADEPIERVHWIEY